MEQGWAKGNGDDDTTTTTRRRRSQFSRSIRGIVLTNRPIFAVWIVVFHQQLQNRQCHQPRGFRENGPETSEKSQSRGSSASAVRRRGLGHFAVSSGSSTCYKRFSISFLIVIMPASLPSFSNDSNVKKKKNRFLTRRKARVKGKERTKRIVGTTKRKIVEVEDVEPFQDSLQWSRTSHRSIPERRVNERLVTATILP